MKNFFKLDKPTFSFEIFPPKGKGDLSQIFNTVDALASLSLTRLCTTVQVTDAGICPGSGVGNARAAFSRESLGVPVIAVGVPTVVDAGTLARELTGEEPVRDDGGARMIVTPREIDVRVADMAKVIGYGLNLALHDGMTVADAALFLS